MTTAPVRTAQEHQNDHIAPFSLPSARPCAPAPVRWVCCWRCPAATTSAATNSSRQVIGNFYRIHLKNHAPGLPSAEELKQFEPLVSRPCTPC
jgi:hypothetical protein